MPGVCRLHRYTFAAGAPFAVFLLPPFALLLPVSLALSLHLLTEGKEQESAIGDGLILAGILVSELPDSKKRLVTAKT